MASKQSEVVFQCSGCQKELDLESKTLPCLHSYCRSCLDKHFEEETNGNGHCPECYEPLTLDQLSLSPFLVKFLRCRQLESTDWKCDLCSEDGIESAAINWCHDCQELFFFCANCSRCHKKFQPKHNSRDLDEMERGEVIEAMRIKVWEQLKTLTVEEQDLEFYEQWNLRGSNSDIYSIYVSKEDNHVFLCDTNNQSIIEFTESGELVCECNLFDGTNKFYPWDMCSISPDVFVVVCGEGKKLIFLEKRKIPPFLQIKKFIDTENKFYSVCQINDSIFACNYYFQIDSFTKEGEKIRTIKPEESGRGWPLIRADPSTGNIWGTRLNSSKIFCFNRDGQKLRSLETEVNISDFCVNEERSFYFCNHKGFFCNHKLLLSSKMILYKFEVESEFNPRIFVLGKKIFVSLKIGGKSLLVIPCE